MKSITICTLMSFYLNPIDYLASSLYFLSSFLIIIACFSSLSVPPCMSYSFHFNVYFSILLYILLSVHLGDKHLIDPYLYLNIFSFLSLWGESDSKAISLSVVARIIWVKVLHLGLVNGGLHAWIPSICAPYSREGALSLDHWVHVTF